MVIVAHEIGIAKEVRDQIVYMHDRKIVEVGSPTEIFTNLLKNEPKTSLAR
ncbi:hypothetical protein [Oceanobacillus sp. 1P07AA]|uniref:hypothetical protein n=1 Tax=Oceanobacillus sp. 1P07AA TaxID=3132293 RepID=UPI0039A5B05C